MQKDELITKNLKEIIPAKLSYICNKIDNYNLSKINFILNNIYFKITKEFYEKNIRESYREILGKIYGGKSLETFDIIIKKRNIQALYEDILEKILYYDHVVYPFEKKITGQHDKLLFITDNIMEYFLYYSKHVHFIIDKNDILDDKYVNKIINEKKQVLHILNSERYFDDMNKDNGGNKYDAVYVCQEKCVPHLMFHYKLTCEFGKLLKFILVGLANLNKNGTLYIRIPLSIMSNLCGSFFDFLFSTFRSFHIFGNNNYVDYPFMSIKLKHFEGYDNDKYKFWNDIYQKIRKYNYTIFDIIDGDYKLQFMDIDNSVEHKNKNFIDFYKIYTKKSNKYLSHLFLFPNVIIEIEKSTEKHHYSSYIEGLFIDKINLANYLLYKNKIPNITIKNRYKDHRYLSYMKYPTKLQKLEISSTNFKKSIVLNEKEWNYNEFNNLINIYERKKYSNKILKSFNIGYDNTQYYRILIKNEVKRQLKLNYSPSAAFCKCFEILSSFQLLNFNENLLTIHVAEAPGNFILATQEFLKFKNFKKNHDWLANSLNHKSQINIEKYGNVFGDVYGVIKNNVSKWLYGKDDTGDITNPDNIMDIKKRVDEYKQKKGLRVNLITGDAGLEAVAGINDDELYILQKLEFAQTLIILMLSNNGSNCIVKHFCPIYEGNINSRKSIGFTISIVYLYSLYYEKVYFTKPYTSNHGSGEYYIVGLNFKENNTLFPKLLKILPNFNNQVPLFPKKYIEYGIFTNIYVFFCYIIHLISEYMNYNEIRIHCHNKKNDVCNEIQKYNFNVLKYITKSWIKEYLK